RKGNGRDYSGANERCESSFTHSACPIYRVDYAKRSEDHGQAIVWKVALHWSIFTSTLSPPTTHFPSITFTAICLFSPAENGALFVPAKCSQTASSCVARRAFFKFSQAPVRGKNA